MSRLTAPSTLIATGALGVAGTTALEVLTAPYSDAVTAYPLNGAVHVVKVLAVVVLVVGLLRWLGELRRQGEAVAAGAVGALVVGVLLGAVPYSVAEATLDPGLSPAAADARLTAIHEAHPWIGVVASVALPVILVGIVVLAVVVLRHRLLPAWAPVLSLAAIPVAVLAGVLGDAGWAVPHPPAWLFLGLAAYGPALAQASRVTSSSEPSSTQVELASPGGGGTSPVTGAPSRSTSAS